MTALGHCRLSIVDLSPEGDQPLHDAEGHIHAVVMGEIYDDDILREQCIREFGYSFKGRSDSELVIALYKHYGAPGFLDHLRGEYAFLIYDDQSGEIIAARDRFGVKPLFWTVVGDKLLIAPEIKAFLPLGWKPEWDVDAIVLGSWSVGTGTLFKSVNRVSQLFIMKCLICIFILLTAPTGSCGPVITLLPPQMALSNHMNIGISNIGTR